MLRVPISHFQIQNYIIYVTGDVVSLHVGLSPPQDCILSVTFRKGPGMAALLGSVVYASTPPGLTARRVTVTFVSGAPSVTFDALDPAATFPCNDGDVGSVTSVAVNLIGEAPPSDPFSFTAVATITSPPPQDVISGVHFVEAELVARARKK